MLTTSRRTFLAGLFAAPAVVHFANIMPVAVRTPQAVFVPDTPPFWFDIEFGLQYPDVPSSMVMSAPMTAADQTKTLWGPTPFDSRWGTVEMPTIKRRWIAKSDLAGTDTVWLDANATAEEIADRKEGARQRHWINRNNRPEWSRSADVTA